MIQILLSVERQGQRDSATDFSDLKTIVTDAATLNMPGYVQVLAGDVVNGNAANANYQGQALGNLAAGSSASQIERPDREMVLRRRSSRHRRQCPAGQTYVPARPPVRCSTALRRTSTNSRACSATATSSRRWAASPTRSPAAVENMFLDNGDGTWTVRFYDNGVADYVTVNRMLPTNSGGYLVYADYGSMVNNVTNTLWIPLAEKAYAQWNETGKEGRDGTNTYSGIEGGWMANVFSQVLGHSRRLATSLSNQQTPDQCR